MRVLAEHGQLSRVQRLLLDMIKSSSLENGSSGPVPSVRHYDCVVIAAGKARSSLSAIDEVSLLMLKHGVQRDTKCCVFLVPTLCGGYALPDRMRS
jgi:hypothetical protein